MDQSEQPNSELASRLKFAFELYLKLLGLCFIGFTLLYWMRVSGYYEGAEWRFDTMSTPWQIAGATLSVLMPIAAVGLWSTLSWGQVAWVMAVTGELSMYLLFSDYFGHNSPLVQFHLASIAIYLVLYWANYINAKKE